MCIPQTVVFPLTTSITWSIRGRRELTREQPYTVAWFGVLCSCLNGPHWREATEVLATTIQRLPLTTKADHDVSTLPTFDTVLGKFSLSFFVLVIMESFFFVWRG